MEDHNRRKMSLPENFDPSSSANSLNMNKFRRAMSDTHAVPAKFRRFVSNPPIGFLPLDDGLIEDDEKSSDGKSISHHGEVRMTLPEESMASPTMKIHPVKAWFRRTIPDYITCQQVWLVIHALVAITLCVLYFTHTMKISAGTIAICELLFGVLVRNEIFVALLHRYVGLIPYFKYEFNRMLHCIGGLHVSSALAAFFWLLVSLSYERHGLAARITGGLVLLLIIFLSLTAMPIIRRRFHNIFEHIHRYMGWTALIILITHVVCLKVDKYEHFTAAAIFNAPVLVLIAIVVIIFLPWMCIRKVVVQFKQPSKDLTIITFPQALYPYGSTTRISLDGHEWHAFAIALSDPCADEHSILVAAAGDWTKSLAENYRTNKLPEKVWTRKIKGLGFMYSIHAYRKVLIVCTGSGIAPAMPYIKDPLPTTHTHLLWIAKQHEQNYGEYIWKLVQKTYPNYTLHDTAISGRPGPQLVEEHFWKTNSQAVFVVSNEKFTLEAINALWRKGIPCFGALFDS